MSGTDTIAETTGNGTTDNAADDKMRRFELYIKASAIDKETKGSCPICQQFFMITCLLGENQDDIDFKVFTVQAECPPKNFAVCWSKKYPVVMVNTGRNKFGQNISGMMYDTFEELESFFESINTECPELKRKNAPNVAALAVVENLYKHFNHFIAGQTERGLVAELKKLNEYLESQDTRFLVDNVLSFSDCHLLPRLQHIRVAGKAYRSFDIPKEFKYIWKYMQNAYLQDAFRSTMPSDQDIINHYEKKVPLQYRNSTSKSRLGKFTFTMEVPEDCRQDLASDNKEQILDDEDYIPVAPPSDNQTESHEDHHDHDSSLPQSTEEVTPSTEEPTPSTEEPTPSTEEQTPSGEEPTPSTEEQTPSSPTTEEHLHDGKCEVVITEQQITSNGTADKVEQIVEQVAATEITP